MTMNTVEYAGLRAGRVGLTNWSGYRLPTDQRLGPFTWYFSPIGRVGRVCTGNRGVRESRPARFDGPLCVGGLYVFQRRTKPTIPTNPEYRALTISGFDGDG